MTCEPCTFSQESEEGYLQTSFSDMSQLSLLSGINTPVEFCANEPMTDGSQDCTCGKEMSVCSIHPSTPEKWIAYMRDSLARTLALLESRQAYLREPEAVFTVKSCALLASFDRDTCSWKTLQQYFLTDSEPFSQTWPRWGMTQDGVAYAHPMSELITTEIDGGYWPTPVKSDGLVPFAYATMERKEKGLNRPSGAKIGSQLTWDRRALPWVIGGRINPNLQEWMNGLPHGWTDLQDAETPKSRCKPQPHGDCSKVSE